MLYTTNDIAKELAAQLPDTDLGVTNTEAFVTSSPALNGLDQLVEFRMDNDQRFQLIVTQVGGPKA